MFPDGEGLQEVRPEGDVQTSGVGCVTGRIHGLVIHQDAGEAAEGSAVRRIPADRKGQVLFGALGPFAAVPFGTGIDDIFIIFVPGTGLSARRDPFSFNVRGIVPACAGAFTGRGGSGLSGDHPVAPVMALSSFCAFSSAKSFPQPSQIQCSLFPSSVQEASFASAFFRGN